MNITYYQDGEYANAEVMNRPIKQLEDELRRNRKIRLTPESDAWVDPTYSATMQDWDPADVANQFVEYDALDDLVIPLQIKNDSHTHDWNNLTKKSEGTGEYSTTGAFESGRGSGGVALTINDGYGEANVTFNHKDGSPEQDGNAGRISVNTDSGTAEMSFHIGDVTTVDGSIKNVLNLSELTATFTEDVHVKIDDKLTVDEETVLNGPLSVNATANFDGNFTIDATAAGENITLNGPLDHNGLVHFDGNFTIDATAAGENITLNGPLDHNGLVHFDGDFTVDATGEGENFYVTAPIVLDGDFTVHAWGTGENIQMNGPMDFNGSFDFDGDFTIDATGTGENITMSGPMDFNGTAHFDGDFTVDATGTGQDINLVGPTFVNGSVTLNSADTDEKVDINSNELDVDATNINLTGITDVDGDFTVTANAVGENITLTGPTSITGATTVTGVTIIDGKTTINANGTNESFTINGHTQANGNISSTGNLTIDGTVTLGKDSTKSTTVKGDLIVEGDFAIGSADNLVGTTFNGDVEITNNGKLTLHGSLPELHFKDSIDTGVDWAMKVENEHLVFFEPEDSDKVHMTLKDDIGLDIVHGLVVGGNISVLGKIDTVGNVQGSILISDAADGTAPLAVTSSTVVTNLNADMLDGYHQTAFGKLDTARTWTAKQSFNSGLDTPTIYSDTTISVLNGGAAQNINVGGLLVSSAYADATLVPANGIFSAGDVKIGKTTAKKNLTVTGSLSVGGKSAIDDSGNLLLKAPTAGTADKLIIQSANTADTAWRKLVYHTSNDLVQGTDSLLYQPSTGDLKLNGGISVTIGTFFGIGEGMQWLGDSNYFGTNLDGQILRMLDTNGTNGQVDGGFVIQAYTPTDSKSVELLRVRNNEFKYKGNDVLTTNEIPAATTANNGKVLKIVSGEAVWATDTNTTYSTATSTTAGLVKIGYTESGKNYPVELDSGKMYVNVPWTDTDTVYTHPAVEHIPANGSSGQFLGWDSSGKAKWVNNPNTDTVYTHPTTSGNKHIPANGSSGQFLGWSSDGTAKWVNNPNTDTNTWRPVVDNLTSTSTSSSLSANQGRVLETKIPDVNYTGSTAKVVFDGGLIIQYFEITSSADSSETFAFPYAFPNQCICAGPLGVATNGVNTTYAGMSFDRLNTHDNSPTVMAIAVGW